MVRQFIYPKGGDSTFLRDDSPVVLDCFGEHITKFSIGEYIWDWITQASEDVVRHFPYAPYIMHIIEQVSGIKFPTDARHTILKISNTMSPKAKDELKKAKGARASGSTSRASPPHASRSRRATSEEPASSSSSSNKSPSKFKFFMKYMFGACCASAKCEQEMLVA